MLTFGDDPCYELRYISPVKHLMIGCAQEFGMTFVGRSLTALALALVAPLCLEAQQIDSVARGGSKVEISLNRAVKTPGIEVLMSGRQLPVKEKKSLQDALSRLEKSCGACMITVTDDPPVLTSGLRGSASKSAKFTLANALPSDSADVAKAEDCPTDKPFYDSKQKRCYSIHELLASIRNGNQTK